MQWQLCQGWVSTGLQRKVVSRRGSLVELRSRMTVLGPPSPDAAAMPCRVIPSHSMQRIGKGGRGSKAPDGRAV
jgi:hypothetical protein